MVIWDSWRNREVCISMVHNWVIRMYFYDYVSLAITLCKVMYKKKGGYIT